MNQHDFQCHILDETFQAINKINAGKGHEYRRGSTDVLVNFKRLGTQLNLSPFHVLFTYVSKHWDSLSTFIAQDPEHPVMMAEPIEGRIDDIIMYLLLLKGLIWENVHDDPNAHPIRDTETHVAPSFDYNNPGREFMVVRPHQIYGRSDGWPSHSYESSEREERNSETNGNTSKRTR